MRSSVGVFYPSSAKLYHGIKFSTVISIDLCWGRIKEDYCYLWGGVILVSLIIPTYFKWTLRLFGMQCTKGLAASLVGVSLDFRGRRWFRFKDIVIFLLSWSNRIWTWAGPVFTGCAHANWNRRRAQRWTQRGWRRTYFGLFQHCRLPGKSCNEIRWLVAMIVVSNNMAIAGNIIKIYEINVRCYVHTEVC